MKNSVQEKRGFSVWVIALAVILSTYPLYGCGEGSLYSIDPVTEENEEMSPIDQKPVKVISEQDYYLGQAAYLKEVIRTLAENGPAVVSAFNQQRRAKIAGEQSDTDLEIVGFDDIRKSRFKSGPSALDDLSSHLKIVSEEGDAEEFELVLRSHYNPGQAKQKKVSLMSQESSWLALDPDLFFVEEDEEGNEIWPVTFPATSLADPGLQIEVTLDRDGTLTWPETAKSKAKTLQAAEPGMIYADNLAIIPPDEGSGGGSTTEGSIPSFKNYKFLALKTLRLHDTGDGSGAAELLMHVNNSDNYDNKFSKHWDFSFDYKRGINGRWVNPISWAISYLLYPDLMAQFTGRNRKTLSPGGWIYEVPDVNHKNIDYHFTNMRRWVQDGRTVRYLKYEGRKDYFPLALLNDVPKRCLLTENDKRYDRFSARRTDTRETLVQTYDMADGRYKNTFTRIAAHEHVVGNSDETLMRSGVRRITLRNVNERISQGNITARYGNFKYVFVAGYFD